MNQAQRNTLFQRNYLSTVGIAELACKIAARVNSANMVMYAKEERSTWQLAVKIAHQHAESLLSYIATINDDVPMEFAQTQVSVWSSAWLIVALNQALTTQVGADTR